MGIKHLNKFLKENASSSIKLCHLSELSGKTIAVDISIYMYKYASDNTLIENIYLMISIFRHYKIIPIFIFDGKPPLEKYNLIQKRKNEKQLAENEYNKLQDTLNTTPDISECEKQDIIYSMDMLKKKIVTITKQDIENVKTLITSYGCTYYDAPSEADELCAALVIKNKVWACLSEDMDMFVYGCGRVIRYISLLKHTLVLYDMKEILSNLGITQKEFREICVLSGTDYNIEYNKTNVLEKNLKYFKKYHKSKSQLEFYEWLKINHENVITDYELLKNNNNIFDLSNNNYNNKLFNKFNIVNGPILKEELMNILKKDGFIFASYE